MRNKLNFAFRPKCIQCDKDAQFMGSYSKNGTPQFRKFCSGCHGEQIAKKHGLKSIKHVLAENKGVDYTEYGRITLLNTAKNKGYNSISEYLTAKHPYRRYRKTYCENAEGENAGWLGFTCTTSIVHPELQLDVDHIDGNPTNNDSDNLMTLCKCCHSIKSNFCGDYATPGRKTLKVRNV